MRNLTTTITTVLEYAVMDIQRYEFTCSSCFVIKSRNDHAIGSVCKDCS